LQEILQEIGTLQKSAIPKMRPREAKQAIINMVPPLQDHLIKLAVYGDRYAWKQEAAGFAIHIQQIRLSSRSREFLTQQQYHDTMRDWTKSGDESSFSSAARIIMHGMLNLKPKRSIAEAQQTVLAWQNELTRRWSEGKITRQSVLKLLSNA
jgi:hypothetical protein